MAREYAYRRPNAKKRPAPHGFLTIAFSFLLGYLAAYLFDAEHLRQFVNKQVLASDPPKPAPVKPVAKKAEPAPTKPKFEFYTLLANEKAKSKPPTAETAQNPKPAEKTVAAAPKSTPTPAPTQKPATPIKAQAVVVREAKPLAPITASKQRYIVQIAAFNTKKDADQMKANLTLRGYSVSILPAQQATGMWFRVILGPYSSKLAAQQAKLTVAKNEHLQGMVKTA